MMTLYHRTTPDRAEAILRDGLKTEPALTAHITNTPGSGFQMSPWMLEI
jgi:hypothetical protein